MSRDSRFYITTAIDYVNDKPHLGHALEKIQADVLARYARLKYGNENVMFLTGTDEHGVKIQRAAEKAGKDAKKFVDETSAKFEGLKKSLNLSYGQFIRTTDEKTHYPGVIKIWNKLLANGDLEKRTYRGLYCVGHEAFVTEKDLVKGLCADHGREPEIIEEENWFFLLSKYTAAIKWKIQSGEMQILPATRRNEILALLDRGLEDISFSRPKRSVSWGIPVPNDQEQTMYVWADALTNYISAIGYGRDEKELKKWWPADVQVIGKDVLRFHAAIWPAMLLSAGLQLPKKLLVHGFITVDGQKMSKTIGNVIDPVEIADKYGADALRYYLLKEIPSGEDGDFSMEKFTALYNSDLANGIGNLTARVLKMAATHDAWPKTAEEADLSNLDAQLQKFQINRAVSLIWEDIQKLDALIQAEQPFKLVKTEPDRAKKIMTDCVVSLQKISAMLEPFLPETSDKIQTAIENRELSPTLFPRI